MMPASGNGPCSLIRYRMRFIRWLSYACLSYRLTYDASKWQRASVKCQEVSRQLYLLELDVC
jgi:hypothetical protein